MKKLVIKTSLITLACIVGASIIAFFSLWLFSPKSLGKVFDGVGSYSVSVYFYEQSYNKSKDIVDLALLVDKLDENTDNERLETYLEKMVTADSFDEYCLSQDSGQTGLISTKEYYTGIYAITLINNDKLDTAIDFMTGLVKKDGYTENNAFRTVISEFSQDKTVLNKCLTAITNEYDNLTGEGVIFATNDIDDINNLLNN